MKIRSIAFFMIVGAMLCLERLEGSHPPAYSPNRVPGYGKVPKDNNQPPAYSPNRVPGYGKVPKDNNQPPTYSQKASKNVNPYGKVITQYGKTPDEVHPDDYDYTPNQVTPRLYDLFGTEESTSSEDEESTTATKKLKEPVATKLNIDFSRVPEGNRPLVLLNRTGHKILITVKKNSGSNKSEKARLSFKKKSKGKSEKDYVLKNELIKAQTERGYAVFWLPWDTIVIPLCITIMHGGLNKNLETPTPILAKFLAYQAGETTLRIFYNKSGEITATGGNNN